MKSICEYCKYYNSDDDNRTLGMLNTNGYIQWYEIACIHDHRLRDNFQLAEQKHPVKKE